MRPNTSLRVDDPSRYVNEKDPLEETYVGEATQAPHHEADASTNNSTVGPGTCTGHMGATNRDQSTVIQ